MTVLVTGGAGYIGTHTCIELLNEGYKVIVLDNFSNSNPEAINRVMKVTGKQIRAYQADLLDRQEIEKVFEENKIEAVIHFAGFKAVGESVANPLKYYHNNIVGTLNLCEVMNKFHVKQLVFSSSATVYDAANQMPVSEEGKIGAINPYGRTKQMIEEILRDLYISDNKWSIALLRYFNPVGADPSGLIGEDPNGIPNNLVPYISQVAAGKLGQLNVFGNDYPTHDGTGIRDYIHVVDLAAGHLKALKKVQSEAGVESYNLGTGKGFSVLDMVKAFERASGKKIPFQIMERRPGDIATCYADTAKAKEQLGWQAEKDIDEMCRDSWNWQKNNPDGYVHKLLV